MVDLAVEGKKKKKTKTKNVESENKTTVKRKVDEEGQQTKIKKLKGGKGKKKKESGDSEEGKPMLKEKNEKVKKKKSIKFDETVKVKEIAGNKKEKLDAKIKNKKKSLKAKSAEGKEEKPFEKLNKQETREKQKKDKSERRAKKQNQDVYDIGIQAKKIWEEVRKDDCSEEKKKKLSAELHSLVKGNIIKIIYAHDTVRVVECLMALGSDEIKQELFIELKEHIVEMSKSMYAHFFVEKLLRYGSKEQREVVFKKLEGNVARLMKHKTAGVIVELGYNDYASAGQRNSFLQEFLGPEFRLFKEKEIKTVAELIAKYPEKKDELVKNLGANIDVLIQKGCFNHSLVHTLLNNYLAVVGPGKKRADTIESMRENLIHILHSREGAHAAIRCIWHGNNKDRKSIVKSLKTFVEKTCYEEYGHMVLQAIFDCVDDTKLVGKAILGELSDVWDTVIQNKFGLRVIKYLMAGRDSAYTYPEVVKLLSEGDGNEHSKKDPIVRRKELVESVAPTAFRWIGERLLAGLHDPPSTITLTAILNNLPAGEQLDKVWSLLAEEASKPFIPGDDNKNIIEPAASNMMMKKIILKDKERAAKGVETFSKVLLKTVDQDGLEAWLSCNRGAFLLIFCWETEVEEIQNLIQEKLKTFKQTLRQKKTKGVTILSEKLEGK